MEEEKIKNTAAALEALLFIHGEPMALSRIEKILKAKSDLLKESAVYLSEKLKKEDGGLVLVENDDRLQLATKSEYSDLLKQLIQEETRESLTPAALETLSIIAYAGPLPRSVIDYIRGVNSSFILRSLLIRGLIGRKPDPKRSNVYLYQASFDLLKHLNLPRIEDLPEYQKYKELLDKMVQS